MEIQTSFIPKKSLTAQPTQAGSRPVGLLLLLAVLIFVAAVLVHGGVLLYGAQLDKSIKGNTAQLRLAEQRFDPGILDLMSRLDAKITIVEGASKTPGNGLLAKHITLLPLLDYMERTTLPSVRYRSFKFNANDNGSISVKMTGQARSYTSVALQSGEYTKAGAATNFHDLVFSDLNLDNDGTVNFNFSATVDPLLTSYSQVAKKQAGL